MLLAQENNMDGAVSRCNQPQPKDCDKVAGLRKIYHEVGPPRHTARPPVAVGSADGGQSSRRDHGLGGVDKQHILRQHGARKTAAG